MALSRFSKGNSLLSRLCPFRAFERFMSGDESPAESALHLCQVDISKWQKLNARKLGVERSMISKPCRMVLMNLHSAGYEAYLVGGCVRDLILKRIPKDFDVITTAKLKQIRRMFRKALIVGKRFPICMVKLGGCVVEVSSFSTAVEKSNRKQVRVSKMPTGCDDKDFTLWNDSMQRDFTINSLFYDPFSDTIFDYVDAIKDLRSLKLQTLVPAHLAFEEDPAKILRGLRFAARLGLSISKETETAIHNLSSIIASIGKARIALEINYMLCYGAAEPSLLLLKRFKLLEIFLPVQAAYLSTQAVNQLGERSSMLVKLFSSLDRLITCNRPCDGSLWLAVLAFHLALFKNPQHAAVILNFASLLYHGRWEESIKFARQYTSAVLAFAPEILDDVDTLSDGEIAEKVTQFALQVNNSLKVFTDMDCVFQAMATFPDFPSSGLVFTSRKMVQKVEEVMRILFGDVTSFKTKRKSFDIDYHSATEGRIDEIRFVLGKIIIDTLLPTNTGENRVIQLEKGGRRRNYKPQKSEVFTNPRIPLQISTTFRQVESMSKDENKRRDRSIVNGGGLCCKQGNESSDLLDRRLNPDKTEKDKHDKAKLEIRPPSFLSDLFK